MSVTQPSPILSPLRNLSMEICYKIVWIVAFSVDLCVIVAFLKTILLKWMDITLQNILEDRSLRFQEKKLAATEAIILQREMRRDA
jgi:hypothetical protein